MERRAVADAGVCVAIHNSVFASTLALIMRYRVNTKNCKCRMMDEEDDEEALLLFVLYRRCRRRRRRRARRRCWVRQIYSKRKERGSFSTLVQEMRLTDPELHFRYFRMSRERFDDLLHKVNSLS